MFKNSLTAAERFHSRTNICNSKADTSLDQKVGGTGAIVLVTCARKYEKNSIGALGLTPFLIFCRQP